MIQRIQTIFLILFVISLVTSFFFPVWQKIEISDDNGNIEAMVTGYISTDIFEKDNETISKECIKMVRDKIGPVAAFKVAIVIKRLPKTRSGKILRGTIRKIADNVEYKMPPTIDDPAILDEIKEDLIKNNILKSS